MRRRYVDNMLPDDESESWDAWNITFFGQVPQIGKESEGSIQLDFDVIIDCLEWKFPMEIPSGWVATVYANQSPIIDLDLASDPQGYSDFKKGYILPAGGVISARIYYAEESDLRPLVDSNKAHKLGYSIILSGMQISSGQDPFTKITRNTDEEEKRVWKQWRQEMV
tara:strand:+ start:59 stop:559 length:501 start_codon:yes stop_codon:yes gene_type:complete